VHTDTADGLLATATVPAVDIFGWTMCSAMEQKQISQTVHIAAGDVTTVNTVTMSLSRAIRVYKQTVCRSKQWHKFKRVL